MSLYPTKREKIVESDTRRHVTGLLGVRPVCTCSKNLEKI